MAGLPEISDTQNIRREMSPDGAMALDLHRCFDPRDIHEQSEQRRPELYDARSGVLLLGLTTLNRDCHYHWRDGGVDLELFHPHLRESTKVFVTRGPLGWQAAVDGGLPGSIGQAKMRLAGLGDPSRPQRATAASPPRRIVRVLSAIGVVVLFGGGVAWMVMDARRGELRFPKVANVAADLGNNRADGWMVMCPAPVGAQHLKLDADGRLLAPRLTQEPLSPVPEVAGRYTGKDLTVLVSDHQVVLLRNHDPQAAITCRGMTDDAR